MPKKWPPRPSQNFKLTSLAWQLQSEATHRQAGFPPIGEAVLRRRYWQFLEFLQEHDFTTRVMASSIEDIGSEAEIWNADLTPSGYAFAQRFADRWAERMHKDLGEQAEWQYLEKWLQQLMQEAEGA